MESNGKCGPFLNQVAHQDLPFDNQKSEIGTTTMRTHPSILILLSIATAVSADVLCPRVTSQHNADVTDLRRFRRFHAWADLQNEELAVAIWQYLCSTETGLYHMNMINDGTDPWVE